MSKTLLKILAVLLFVVIGIYAFGYFYDMHVADKTILQYKQMRWFVVISSVLCLVAMVKKYDFVHELCDWYVNVDPVYKRSFYVVFIAALFVFSFHMYNMMFGNHAWYMIRDGQGIKSYFGMGRYGTTVLKNLFFNGHYIPVLSYVASFVAMSLAGVFLCIYWRIRKNLLTFTICGLLVVLQPFIIEWLYFIEGMPDFFFIPLLVVSGLMLLEKGSLFWPTNKFKCIFFALAGTALLNFAISIYPVAINTIAVLFCGRVFVWAMDENLFENFKKKLWLVYFSVGGIIVSGLCFKIGLAILKYFYKYKFDGYTIKQISFTDIPQRICEVITTSFSQLLWYELPFMPNAITELFFVLLLLLILVVSVKTFDEQQWHIKLPLRILFLVLAVIAMNVSNCLSAAKEFYQARLDFYGMVYLRVLIAGAVLTYVSKVWLKNFAVLCSCGIIWVSTVGDLYCQKVWKFGNDSDMMLWNRLLARMEMQKDFSIHKKYVLIHLGDRPSARQKYYTMSRKMRGSCGLLTHPFDPIWMTPWTAEDWYYQHSVFKQRIRSRESRYKDPVFKNSVMKLYKAGILAEALKDIDKNDVVRVRDDVVLVVTNKKELQQLIKSCVDGKFK